MERPALNPRLSGAMLAGFTFTLGAGLILSQRISSRAAFDQKIFHGPAIVQFMEQWPHFDFWHYLSATTPGYHLLMAAIGKLTGGSVLVMQWATLLIATTLSGLLGTAAGRFVRPGLAVALAIPVACSMYTVQSSAWLLPDNLGWLGVLIVLLIALRDRPTARSLALGGLALFALVWVRQIHVWTAGLLWLTAALPTGSAPAQPCTSALFTPVEARPQRPTLLPDIPAQLKALSYAFALTLPGIIVLFAFMWYWQGLVPAVFRGVYHGLNTSAGVFILATLGSYSPFFMLIWWKPLRSLWRQHRAWLIGPVLIVLLFAIAVPTDDNYAEGRRTGLWHIAAVLPVIAGRISPFMVALTLLGATAIAALASAIHVRQRLIFLAAIAGYAAVCTANHDLFQRYVDPFALLLLALMSAMAFAGGHADTPPQPGPVAWRWRAVGPGVLALALLAIFFRGFITDHDRMSDPPPPANEPGQEAGPWDQPPPPRPLHRRFPF